MFLLWLLPQTTHLLVPDLIPLPIMYQRHVHVPPTKRGGDVNELEQRTDHTLRKAASLSPHAPGLLLYFTGTQ